jgi:putative ABC transport system permease protein
VPTLVDRARSVASAAELRTRSTAWAGVALGLAAVLAVAVLGVGRRRAELRLDAGLGIRSGSVAVCAVLECLPAALLAVVAGTAAAAALVSLAGPPGPTTGAAVAAGARAALAAAGVGLLLVLVVSWLSALAATRPVRTAASRRLPWEVLLGVVAATAAVGLLGRPSSGAAGPGTLDLLVPLLVLAAVGAVGGRLLLRAGSRAVTRSPAVGPGRPSLWLAAKRLAGVGDDRLLVVTLLTAGLGMLGYALAAASSVATTAEDRVAVLSGARGQAQIGASWQLDPSAPKAPTQRDIAKHRPLPVVGDPRLPTGDTVVWRRTTTVPSLFGDQGLLVIDPPSFAAAASWGRGPELAQARGLLPALDAAGHEAARRFDVGDTTTPVPVLVTAGSGLRRGDVASVAGPGWVVAVRVLDVVDAFPGHDDATPLLVAPSDGFFAHLGPGDPRYRPAPDVPQPSPTFSAYAWSAGGSAALDRLLGAAHVTPLSTASDAQTRQLPELVATRWGVGYLGALGAGLALLSIVGLALYADRTAARSRASDVLLARLGLGRRGVRRSHALELALLVLTALLLAAVGGWVVTRLGPLGLDPGSARAPSFRLRPGTGALAGAVVAGGVALLAAVAVVRARGRDATDGTVLRDAE